MSSTPKPRRAVILTALEVEYVAVREHLSDLREEIHDSGTIYERGISSGYGQTWDVRIVQVGAGNSSAGIEAVKALVFGDFKPEVMLFVGVAGGLKDVRRGDVVVATKVYGYESGKADEQFKIRPEIGQSTYPMINRARVEARGTNAPWLQRIKGAFMTPAPKALVGALAAGEKVIASTSSTIYDLLRTSYGDSLGVDMESYGFLRAVFASEKIDALVVRGISDLIDNKAESDAANYQEIASRHASAFAFEVLLKLRPGDVDGDMTGAGSEEAMPKSSPLISSSVVTPVDDQVKIFYSSATSDESMVSELRKHFAMLRRRNEIAEWYPEKMVGGENLREQVDQINSADFILIFMSPDYLESEYHYTKNLLVAMERRDKENIKVIPILLRQTNDWQSTPIGHILHLPRGTKALADTSGAARDQMFVDIAREIQTQIEKMRDERKLARQ